MSRKEIIEMAEEAGLPINTGPSGRPGFKALWGPELERFAALVAAKERKRLFGFERDGHARLMLHRWENGKCWAAVTHFTAEQTRFISHELLGSTADRMGAEIAAMIETEATP